MLWLLFSHPQSITDGSQDRNSHRAGTSRQELMQRPWNGAGFLFVCLFVFWLAPCGLLSLLSYRTQDHLLGVCVGDSPSHDGLSFPTSIISLPTA